MKLSNKGTLKDTQERSCSDMKILTQLTFDFLPDRNIKLATLQLLPCWDLHREAAQIQYLSAADSARSAVFPYGHVPCGLEGLDFDPPPLPMTPFF